MTARFSAVLAGLFVGGLVVGPASLAAAAPKPVLAPSGPCAIGGFTPSDGADRLGADLARRRPEEAPAGAALQGRSIWAVPGGGTPVIVVHSGDRLQNGRAELVVGGIRTRMSTGTTGAGGYATTGSSRLVGGWTRTAGVDLRFGPCAGRLVIVVDRPMYRGGAAVVGAVLVVVGVIGAVLLVARRRRGRLRRFLFAAPLAVLAGVGEALLLYESGAVSPFDRAAWWLPAAGLVLLAATVAAGAVRPRSPVPAADPPPAAAAVTVAGQDPPPVDPDDTPTPDPSAAAPAPPPHGPRRTAARRRAVTVVSVVVLLAAAFTAALPRQATAADVEVVGPAAARIVFASLWADARSGHYDRLEEPAKIFASGLFKNIDGFRTNEVTHLAVGVPRGQTRYPAHFVATARTAFADGRTGYFYGLLVRDSADRPWTMREFRMATSEPHAIHPKMTPDGYLAPVPPISELAFDPATVAQRYADWLTRSAKAQAVLADDALAVNDIANATYGIAEITTKQSGARYAGGFPVYRDYRATPHKVRPELVPLADGTVLVSFSVDVHIAVYNNDRPVPRPCSAEWLTLNDSDPRHYQTLTYERRIHPTANVPPRGKATVTDTVQISLSETGNPC